jgi:hypothetical protein
VTLDIKNLNGQRLKKVSLGKACYIVARNRNKLGMNGILVHLSCVNGYTNHHASIHHEIIAVQSKERI